MTLKKSILHKNELSLTEFTEHPEFLSLEFPDPFYSGNICKLYLFLSPFYTVTNLSLCGPCVSNDRLGVGEKTILDKNEFHSKDKVLHIQTG